MANKSMYTDRANKATSRAKGDFLFTQKGDGSEVSKGAEIEVVLASDLDNMDTSNVLAFNPLAGSLPIANSDNTKAYNGDLAKLINPNYALGIEVKSGNAGVISYSNDFAIGQNSVSFRMSGNISFPSSDSSGTFICGVKNGDGTHAFGLFTSAETNKITARAYDGNGDHTTVSPLLYVDPNKLNDIVCVLDRRDNTIKLYLNNILISKTSLLSGFGSITISANPIVFSGSPYISGVVERFTFFNYAITDEELGIIYNSGRPDRAILPDYMKWGKNTELLTNEADRTFSSDTGYWEKGGSSTISGGVFHCVGADTAILARDGLVNLGDKYRIKITVSSFIKGGITLSSLFGSYLIDGNGTYIIEGIAVNTTFFFWCSGDTQLDIDNISIVKLGAVCDLEPSGIVVNSSGKVTAWTDSSTNDNDATVSGTPDLVLVKAEDYEGQGMNTNEFIFKTLDASAGANVGEPLFLPPQWSIVRCIAYNYGSTSVNIKLGSTNGGGEYVSSKSIAAGEIVNFNVPDTKDPYSIDAFSPMYLNSSSWGSAKVKTRFTLMHVPWGE